MRIGFDVSQTAEQMAGCGVVADQLLRHLVASSPSDIFIPYPIFGNYRNPNFAHATRPPAPNVVADQFGLTCEELSAAWDRPAGDLAGFLSRPDVVHANNFFCPIGLPVPIVYTLYDVGQIECPQFHTERNRRGCFDGLFDASLYADHIVAISQFSRQSFLKWFPHVAPARVSVVYPAARPSVAAHVSDDELTSVLRRFEISPDAFWLAVGTIEPRKNYGLLLDVYARLLEEAPAQVLPLYIAGKAGWIESLKDRIQRLHLEEHVRCLGFVEDRDLAVLYRSCFAFLYPSAYEGFGLPLAEAMANGAAVITTRSTSLTEVVGDAGLLAAPDSPSEFLSAMKRLMLEPSLRADLRAAALDQAAKFSWARSASALLELYHSMAGAERSGAIGGTSQHGAGSRHEPEAPPTSSTSDDRQSLVRACWCGNDALHVFSGEYLRCARCETLISRFDHHRDVSRVVDDQADFYGREYWFSHMERDLGFGNIYQRARTDITERCPFWLRTVLKYRTPPGRVLELGSAHGAFVAVLRCAGFDATGLELSPAIADIARDLFGVPMLQGPVENQQLEAGTFDVIILMDVLEHLPSPLQTMQRCLDLLKPDGFLLIQTPKYPERSSLEELNGAKHRFVEMLKPQEHLFLFSASSVMQLFATLGCHFVTFETALFSHYDMFLAVSRQPLATVESARQEQSLMRTPGGRQVQALLDLSGQLQKSTSDYLHAEADRGARLRAITLLEVWLEEANAGRRKRWRDLEHVEPLLKESESDGAKRLEVINELSARLADVEADRSRRLETIARLEARLVIAEADLATRMSRIRALEARILGVAVADGKDAPV